MSWLVEIYSTESPVPSRQFLICDYCFWAASAIATRTHDVVSCPQCRRELSRIPLNDNEKFTFSVGQRRGVEIAFQSDRR